MKYFIDTEFIEGFHKPLFGKRRHFIDLISIGIVAEDGREYYAISSEYDYKDADEWVKQEVIDKLDDRPFVREEIHTSKGLELIRCVSSREQLTKSNKQIAQDIIEFCTGDVIALEKVQRYNVDYSYRDISFYGYYCDYDWVLFCSLFGRMIDLPKGFPMYCIDLKQILDEKATLCMQKNTPNERLDLQAQYIKNGGIFSSRKNVSFERSLEIIKTEDNYPAPFNEHNALADARWNYQLYKFLQTL